LDSAKGDKSLKDSGRKYKPVGVNFVTPLSVGEIDLEFSPTSLPSDLPK